MPLFKHIKCLNVGLHVGEFVKEAIKVIIVYLSKKRQRRPISTFILRSSVSLKILFFSDSYTPKCMYTIHICMNVCLLTR